MSKRSFVRLVLTSALIIVAALATAAARPNTLNRDSIPDEYKWNLSDLYTEWTAWETDLAAMEVKMDQFAALQGKLSEGANRLLESYLLNDELNVLAYKVYRYPSLMYQADTRQNDIMGRLQQVQNLFAEFSTTIAWFNPELLSMPWETVEKWIDETPGLAPYRYTISDLFRQQEHVLDEEKEQLLSYYGPLSSAQADVYSALAMADIDFPEVVLSTGDTVRATSGEYRRVLRDKTYPQSDRKAMFEAHYGAYDANINTYAAIYNGVMQAGWAGARSRNYSSVLAAALDGDNVPSIVYENLVNSVKAGTAPLRRYMELRKKVLGLEEYHVYDGALPLADFDTKFEYDEARKWVLASVGRLGTDYETKMKSALYSGWIDVFENEGKYPGAFCAPVLGVHPYMLMNYNETLGDVFTIAHEGGHMLHSMLAGENQPFANADPTIFVAEVASSTNEALLLDYLLNESDDPQLRIRLLEQSINDIVGSFYGQVMFSDYELRAHSLVEQGQPITSEVLSALYMEIEHEYYGESIIADELLSALFARIPHFYQSPYYVYKYATCYATSAQIVGEIFSGDAKTSKDATERYLALLRAGASDYPMQLLKNAGVDLTQPAPVEAVVKKLDDLVTQLEAAFAE